MARITKICALTGARAALSLDGAGAATVTVHTIVPKVSGKERR